RAILSTVGAAFLLGRNGHSGSIREPPIVPIRGRAADGPGWRLGGLSALRNVEGDRGLKQGWVAVAGGCRRAAAPCWWAYGTDDAAASGGWVMVTTTARPILLGCGWWRLATRVAAVVLVAAASIVVEGIAGAPSAFAQRGSIMSFPQRPKPTQPGNGLLGAK